MTNATANKQPANSVARNSATLPKASQELAVLEREIIKVLPQHVGAEKFIRVVATAISSNQQLARADRKSLFQSALKCAQDGLLPDSREAAFVVFRSKNRQTNKWEDRVQYMPMIRGIVKLMRNSGEVKSINCLAVFPSDSFRHWFDDAGEHVTYEQNFDVPEGELLRAAFAVVETNDGGRYIEVMTRAHIDKVRAVSKSRDDGPWVTWYDEMAQKTVLRRLSKRCPMSTDIERVLRRDEEFFDLRREQRVERSGADAARAMLGLSQALEQPAETGSDAEHDDSPEPQFTEDAALAKVAAATSVDSLKEVWVTIADDFFATGRELPQRLEAAYGDRLEALKQAADDE